METAAEKPFDAFISHAEEDRAWVEGYLLDALRQAGARCLVESAFQLGAPRLVEFERAVARSRRTLLILTPAYLALAIGQFVDLLAQEHGLESASWPVIPILLHQVSLPARLAILVGLDATDPARWDEVVARLCAELQRPLPRPPERPVCPYPGMIPFGEGQALFFGRERETEKILTRLRLHPFLAVIGPSGTGKSSLVFAGVAPALARSSLFGQGRWRIHTLRPGVGTIEELRTLFAKETTDLPNPIGGREEPAGNSLLVVDQFEASFTGTREEWEPYHRELQQFLGRPGWYVVLTVRADFYGDLMSSPLWQEVREHRVEIVPLTGEGLRDAIVKPAAAVGCHVEGELIERLISDAAREPGALPFVQETLVLLWERLQRHFLSLAAYEALSEGDRNGLQVAIAHRADAVISRLSESQQQLARRIFLRLVQFGEGRADTRRRQSREGLRSAGDDPQVLDNLIDLLARCRLLTLGGEEGVRGTVDLAHEALLSGWPTLQRWVVERRGAEQVRRRLEEQVLEWCERVEEGQGGGLLDEVELLEAERWRDGPDALELGYSEDLVALLEASRETLKREAAERQATRDRELRQAQELALEQQRRADDQTQALRRLRIRAAGLAVAMAAAVVTAGVAFWQARISHSRQLAAQAMNMLGRELDQASMLSVRAYRINPNRDTNSSLAAAVQEYPRLETFLHGNPSFAWSVAFSSDGEVIASGNADGTITLWSTRSRQLLCPPITAPSSPVYSVSFAPRSRVLASGHADGKIHLWDVNRCTEMPTRPASHKKAIYALAFSPDGRILASAGDSDEIQLRDGRSLARLPSLPQSRTGAIRSLAFNRDGTFLASGSENGIIILWRVATRKQEGAEIEADEKYKVWSLQFSPVDNVLAAGTEGKIAILWDAITHKKLGLALGEAEDTPGHTGDIMSLTFSPDGRKLATASTDSTIRLWDMSRTSHAPEQLSAHLGQVNSVVFSPDGQWLVSAGWDGKVILWNMQRRNRLARTVAELPTSIIGIASSRDGTVWAAADASGHVVFERRGRRRQLAALRYPAETFFQSVRFSPDGRLVAAAGEDGTISLWDAHSRQPIGETLRGHTGIVWDVTFNRDGVLASAGADGTIALWSAIRHQKLGILRGHLDDVNAVAFSPDGSRLASASDDNSVIVWDMAARRPISRLMHDNLVLTVTFSPDGRYLASGGADQKIRLWDAASLVPLAVSGDLGELVHSLRFSPRDPYLLASLDSGHKVRLWHIPNLSKPVKLQSPNAVDKELAFSPDGKLLAVGGEKVYLVNVAGSAPPVSIPAPTGAVTSVDFSREGYLVADGSGKNFLMWNNPAAATAPAVLSGAGDISSMAMTSDGNVLALGDSHGMLRLWDLRAYRPITAPIATGQQNLTGLAFSPDNRLLTSAGENGTIRIWRRAALFSATNARNTASRHSDSSLTPVGGPLDLRIGDVRSIQFSADGRTLAAAGNDSTVTLWNLRSRKRLRVLKGHGATVYCLAFRPGQSSFLASGGRDRQILLWDLKRDRQVPLLGNSNEINALAFSPDGRLIASASASESIMLWNADTGERIGYWMTTPGKVTAMTFLTPEVLLSAGSDGVVSRWDLRPESWLAIAEHLGNLSGIELEEGRAWYRPTMPAPAQESASAWESSGAAQSAPRKP